MKITSSAFADQGEIPRQHTCEGKDTSPPLAWSDIPSGAKSLALIVDDPDAPDPAAPQRTWVHWVIYNLPAADGQLDQGTTPAGAREGTNDWKRVGWGGPCPPVGRHRYFFKLYALDTTLDLDAATKSDLEAAMRNHIVGRAELVGTYQKQK